MESLRAADAKQGSMTSSRSARLASGSPLFGDLTGRPMKHPILFIFQCLDLRRTFVLLAACLHGLNSTMVKYKSGARRKNCIYHVIILPPGGARERESIPWRRKIISCSK